MITDIFPVAIEHQKFLGRFETPNVYPAPPIMQDINEFGYVSELKRKSWAEIGILDACEKHEGVSR